MFFRTPAGAPLTLNPLHLTPRAGIKEQPVSLDHTPGRAPASARALVSFDERLCATTRLSWNIAPF